MGDVLAADSGPEMGNQHSGKKKKKPDKKNQVSNGNGELSDDDQDYKYVSIVDVTPPPAPEDSLRQLIEVNSEVLKCSVIIGEPNVSVVSVNGDFQDAVSDTPYGNGQVVNGSSTFIEQVGLTNGSHTGEEKAPNGNSTINIESDGFYFAGRILTEPEPSNDLEPAEKDSESSAVVSVNSNETDDGTSSPFGEVEDQSASPNETFYEASSEGLNGFPMDVEEDSLSLEERLVQAVRQTLNGHSPGIDLGVGVQEEVERVVREKLKRQRSGSSDYWNHDDNDDHCIVDFLDKINDDAEARLAAKRQARAEAREIRMRELERMQRETEDGDKVYDIYSTPVEAINRCVRAGSVTTPRSLLSSNNSYHSSRRSSEDSLEDSNSLRDIRLELKELEEKFRKAMIANAQLDNEKAAVAYQVDLFKDRYEELEEQNLQLLREHKETCRQLEQTKRHRTKLQEDLDISQSQLTELAQLVQEKGLVVVEGDCSSSDEESEGSQPRPKKPPKKALVSAEVADVLQQGTGSLDVRLKKYVEERNELLDELRRVKLELEEERAHSRGRHTNGPIGDAEDIQREANKVLGDYKFKLQKAEQDVNTLQANVARLESQVIRYKSAAETSEKLEGELKLEKRKLQRELREALARVEELETSHSHLQKRLDKLKNAKSALLKDL